MKIISKAKIRDFIPKNLQVPLKYLINLMQGHIEEEMKILKLLINPNDFVVDIGGNRGIYTFHLWKIGAKVHVFEPNPKCFEILSKWGVNKNRIFLYQVALSKISSFATLHIPIDEFGIEHDSSASIENLEFRNSREQVVQIQTLDYYEFSDVKFIKIDVEGHEHDVIEGAIKTISKFKPALLIEIEQRHHSIPISAIFNSVIEQGYQGYFLETNKLKSINEFNLITHQSLSNFGVKKGKYINNFLFLDSSKISNGIYSRLLGNDFN